MRPVHGSPLRPSTGTAIVNTESFWMTHGGMRIWVYIQTRFSTADSLAESFGKWVENAAERLGQVL
jgi:hypothetical protein